MLEKTITHQFLRALEHIEFGAMEVTTPDGKQHQFQGKLPGPYASLILRDWRAIPLVSSKGDIGFAEAYRNGWWDCDDLTSLFEIGLQNQAVLDKYIYGSLIGRIASRISYMFTRNTLDGSKKNIHAHYDLGNDFYELWLDKSMTYSSALFSTPSDDLVTAQHNKYDRIIERLNETGRVLEIGCGWGGFADRALTKRDYEVKGLTISNAQHEYAEKRLGGGANIALEDYRLQQGKYENIVSIEMFEAVGESYWPVYFNKIKSLLADKGKAVIQTITIGSEHFERYRSSGDMIRTYIFPGGMLPSTERFAEESKKAGLVIEDTHMFGHDYAVTMDYWLKNFDNKVNEITKLGFDEPFIRLWRFYLTSCIACFKVGRTNVMQVQLAHA